MGKTSHNHSPKPAHASDTKEQENQQTTKQGKREKAVCITPLMRKGYPLIPPPLRSHSVSGAVAEEVEVTGVVVTPMRLSALEGDKRKRMDFPARSKSLILEARRVILMMWPIPLGSGPVVSLITMTTMRIPTSCP